MYNSFITTNYQRNYFLNLTKESFWGNGVAFPQIINKPMLQRYFTCEELSGTDYYILSDDDIILSSESSLATLVEVIKKNPQYAIIGLSWKRQLSKEERSSSWVIADHGDILEMDHVGGVMIIKKGVIRDLGYVCDYPNGIGDDKIIGKIVRERGYKVGLYTKDYFIHLGEGNSTVWK